MDSNICWMRRSVRTLALSLLCTNCQKEITSVETVANAAMKVASVAPGTQQQIGVTTVSNVDELYAAINDAANSGKRIRLEPGVYLLDSTRPNGGRLELQPNMKLEGQQGNPQAVIIDATPLPRASLIVSPFLTGAIRMGRGNNSIEWLSVTGAVNGAAAIDTDLLSQSADIRIAHVIVTGSIRGIDVRNVGTAQAGRVIDAELIENILANNVSGEGQGIRLYNTNGANGAIIRASLRGNAAHGNLTGCLAGTNTTNSSSIEINSTEDHFDGNGIGCVFTGGTTLTSAVVYGNSVKFTARGSTIGGNVGQYSPTFPEPAGMIVQGAFSMLSARAFDNSVDVELWGVRLGQNQGHDVIAWGAQTPSQDPAGTGNSASIILHGISTKADVIAVSSAPAEATATNTVTVIR